MNKINFGIIGLILTMPAFAENVQVDSAMCELFNRLHGVFRTLQILAFVGAAFYIAGWAWKYISSGDAKAEDIKKQGIALLVGFGLLFMIGIILTFVLSTAGMKLTGCPVLEQW